MATLQIWPHYNTIELTSIEELRALFPGGTADALNWCLLSTSGVHGSYGTLDDVEREIDHLVTCSQSGQACDHDDHVLVSTITVLVVQPRLVVLRYGDLDVTRDDLPWLRTLVASSLAAIASSQTGNLPTEGGPQ